jgi:hypothetical protein
VIFGALEYLIVLCWEVRRLRGGCKRGKLCLDRVCYQLAVDFDYCVPLGTCVRHQSWTVKRPSDFYCLCREPLSAFWGRSREGYAALIEGYAVTEGASSISSFSFGFICFEGREGWKCRLEPKGEGDIYGGYALRSTLPCTQALGVKFPVRASPGILVMTPNPPVDSSRWIRRLEYLIHFCHLLTASTTKSHKSSQQSVISWSPQTPCESSGTSTEVRHTFMNISTTSFATTSTETLCRICKARICAGLSNTWIL